MKADGAQKKSKEVVRSEVYVTEIPTKITLEEASADNPFHTENMFIYGYEHEELCEKTKFSDMLFLMMSGELPEPQQSELFDKFLCCLINPGPRYPATRAAMNSGVVRTKIHHILPMSLSVASGAYLGTADVFNAMHFLRKNVGKSPSEVANNAMSEGKFHVHENPLIAPGFGSYYGGADTYAAKLVNFISTYNSEGKYLNFSKNLVAQWQKSDPCIGWLTTGFAAAILCDLGFHPRQGCMIFQMAISPGIAAHGAEKANRPVHDMPFVSEDNYSIDESAIARPENDGE